MFSSLFLLHKISDSTDADYTLFHAHTKKEKLHNSTTQVPCISAQATIQDLRSDMKCIRIQFKMTATFFAHNTGQKKKKWYIKIKIHIQQKEVTSLH